MNRHSGTRGTDPVHVRGRVSARVQLTPVLNSGTFSKQKSIRKDTIIVKKGGKKEKGVQKSVFLLKRVDDYNHPLSSSDSYPPSSVYFCRVFFLRMEGNLIIFFGIRNKRRSDHLLLALKAIRVVDIVNKAFPAARQSNDNG